VPDKAEEGGLIAILFGLGVPFVVRRVGNDSHFKLIGHCYIHGIMDGELVDGEGNGGEIRVRGARNISIHLV